MFVFAGCYLVLACSCWRRSTMRHVFFHDRVDAAHVVWLHAPAQVAYEAQLEAEIADLLAAFSARQGPRTPTLTAQQVVAMKQNFTDTWAAKQAALGAQILDTVVASRRRAYNRRA